MLHFAELSQHDRGDTSKSNGRLVSGIFTSIAEFERELIRDRVRSGLALAKSRGRRLGRPRVVVDASKVARLRAQGESWAAISEGLGIGKGTAQRAVLALPKNPAAPVAASA
jgi:DNA invertase Pin-like site-specific DNA recombinase